MDDEEHPRSRLARRLTELIDLADLPLDRVAARATARRASGQTWTVRAQRISDWRTGEHLPKSDQAFAAVVRTLIEACRARAVVPPGDGVRELLDERVWSRLLREARASPPRPAPPVPPVVPQWSGGCPYRGLAPFGRGDHLVFYGRDRITAKLLDALRNRLDHPDQPGIVIVTGASGAGKSSLLQAGLLPSLGSLRPRAEHWPAVTVQPTAAPLDELARRLAAEAGVDPANARRELREDPRHAPVLVRDVLAAHAARSGRDGAPERLVVIVDPFEEIFTAPADPGQDAARRRRDFIIALHAMATGEAPALVVAVVRSDFLPACAAYDELDVPLRNDLQPVGPMSETELRLAIIGPAEQAGVHVAAGLADVIVSDLRASPDDDTFQVSALPLLSEAMRVTWAHQEDGRLTSRGYERAGGVAHAIQQSAESVYASLSGERQALARQVFHRLTQVTVNGTVRRRRIEYRRADAATGPSDLEVVVESFAAERLLVVENDTVQITHDALLSSWDRLEGWLKEDPAHRALYERLLDDSEEWRRHDEDDSYLYQGFRLDAIRQVRPHWEADRDRYPALQALPLAFLRAAAKAEAKGVRRRRTVVIGLAGLLVVAMVAAIVAFRFATEVSGQQAQTLSRLLAARSESVGESDPTVSALLAASAWRVAPTGDARRGLLNVLRNPYHGAIPGSRALQVACAPDGRTLATVGRDETLRLWDVPGRRPLGDPLASAKERTFAAAFSPAGTILAAGDTAGSVRLWDTATRRPLREPLTGHKGIVWGVSFSADGTTLASGGADGTVRLWDVRTGKPEGGPLTGHRGIVTAVALSRDGRTLASGDDHGTIRLWDTRTRSLKGRPLTGHTADVAAVAFSPDGKVLASGSGDRTVRRWDAATGHPIGTPIRDTQAIYTVAFSPDGTALAAAGDESIVRLWEAGTSRPLGAPLTGFAAGLVRSMCFSPDGAYLAVAGQSADGVLVWRMGGRLPGRRLLGNPPNPGTDQVVGGSRLTYRPRFSPDGRVLAIAGEDSRMRLWDVASRRPIGDPWPERVDDVVFHPGGKIIAIWDIRTGVRLYDLAGRTPLGPPLPCTRPAGAPAFSPDGSTVALSCEDNPPGYANSARFWDVRTGRETAARLSAFYGDLAFSRDGRTLAAFGSGVQVWDLRNRTQVMEVQGSSTSDTISAVAFSPDGRILTLLWHGRIQQLDLAEGESVAPPFTVGAEASAMALTADGGVAVTRNPDNSVLLWETSSQRPLGASLPAPPTGVVGAAMSPDGRTLATIGQGAVTLRDVDFPADPVTEVCALVNRRFSAREWQNYAPGATYVTACP